MSSDECESINCKVVLLGESAVGKTCLVERYTKSEFHDNFAPTLGGTFIEKEISYKKYNKTIKFQIWDTAGQEKYRSINKLFYSDANIAILVYDITRKETFNEIMDNSIESEKIKEVLKEFIKMRKLIKKPLTNRALKNIISKLKKLAGNDETLAVAILDQSITNSWQDIYTLKEDYTIRKTIKSDAISNPETGKVTKVY